MPELSAPHLPYQVPIEAYGQGGFRFAGMSHRGSLLCLPSGTWAWPVRTPEEIDEKSLDRLFAEAATIDFVILGTGTETRQVGEPLRCRLQQSRLTVEAMDTGAAVRTYNIVLGENRRVAAGLLAVPPPA